MGTLRSNGGYKAPASPRSGEHMAAKRDEENNLSFKEHFEEKLRLLQRLGDERWAAHKEVHDMGQRAIDEAVKTLNIRLEAMNEFRAQIYTERGQFVKQEVYASEYKALEVKMEALVDKSLVRLSIVENNQSNQAGRTAAYASIVGAIFILLQILLHFLKWGG